MQASLRLEEINQDIRYGWRIFSRTPGFTAIVVLTLALGIGANTAIFSIIHAVLLRSLPYKDPSRLVAVWDRSTHATGTSKRFNAYTDLLAYRDGNHSFVQLAGANWAIDSQVMSGRGAARDVAAVWVTENLFRLLGAAPAMGRTFVPEDVNRGCAVILSDAFWRKALGGESGIVGKSIRLDDQSCDVLGVMPQSFEFYPEQTQVWTLITSSSAIARNPNYHGIFILGRLKPGVPMEAVLPQLKVLHKQAHLKDRHARGSEPQIFPLEEEFTWLAGRNLRLSLLVLLAAVVAVLLIACVNVANLLLGRSLGRQKELAIRAALGSRRGRLLRQLLTESLLLSLSAAVVGGALATAAVRYFRALNPISMPVGKPVEVNLPVLAFTAGLTVLTALIFGLIPAWKGSQIDLNDALKSSGRSASLSPAKQRIGRALVVFEVMISLVLLAGAGLLIQSVLRFTTAPLGFATDQVVILTLSLPPLSYATPEQRIRYYDRVEERLTELPDVHGFALTSAIPSIGGPTGVLSVDGRPEAENAPNDTGEEFLSAQYFRFFRVPLQRGREFTEADRAQTDPVAIVNDALVREYFRHEDPMGKQLRFRGSGKTESLRVVGVVRDEKHFSNMQEMSFVASPLIYRPLRQDAPTQVFVLIRGAGNASRLEAVVQKELAGLDPAVPVYDVDTLQHFVFHFTAYPQFRAVLLGGFAGLALLLAVVGLYGVLSQFVEQRTQEIGLRVALGAQPGDVLTMILRGGMLLTGAGIALGLLAAWALTRFLSSLLYGVGSTDLLTFAGVSLVLAAAASVAMYVPARRAAKVNPIKALRHE